MYIHGRTKDLLPIIVLDWSRMGEFIKNGEICEKRFCQCHNFFANYILHNMLVPGQVERWITYTNLNQFTLSQMPLSLFKNAANELGSNYIDQSQKSFVVNMTFFQVVAGKLLQRFLDPETVAKMFVSARPDDPAVMEFIHPS